MAKRVPVNFRKSGDSAIVSYDYYDLAEGTGFKLFYGASNAAGSYVLSQNAIYSEAVETATVNTTFTTTWEKQMDIDFDLTAFNLAKNLKGTMLINGCFNYRAANVTDGDPEFKMTFKVRKWNGTTETEIANATTATKTQPTDGNGDYLFAVSIPITLTHFKKGEILRVTAEGYGRTTVNESVTTADLIGITLGHDPMNREGTYITPSSDTPTTITQLKVWCPFQVEL